jgi:hypothetical protein
MRIEVVRRLFPKVWFNADTTEADVTRLATTMSARTKRATLASDQNTIGVHTLLMHSA